MASFTHKYIPKTKQYETNLFIEEYYSSTDVKITMDDIDQTEISYINYSVQEQLKPLYGYSSRTFDDVAVGNRIVTGTFKVPIKNPEPQTQLEDIKSTMSYYGGSDESELDNNENYNDDQQAIMDTIDWIQTVNKTLNTQDEVVYEYAYKLQQLGYSLNMNNPLSIFHAIQTFQHDVELEVNGKLDSFTKDEINKNLVNKIEDERQICVPINTEIKTGPGEEYETIQTVTTYAEAFIGSFSENGWVFVVFDDKEQYPQGGYVKDYVLRKEMQG